MSGEPKQRTLYEFDWDTAAGPAWAHRVSPGTGTQLGWWDGRHWYGLYGDGMWSPDVVTAWREMSVS